jgi:hypothetical protein
MPVAAIDSATLSGSGPVVAAPSDNNTIVAVVGLTVGSRSGGGSMAFGDSRASASR